MAGKKVAEAMGLRMVFEAVDGVGSAFFAVERGPGWIHLFMPSGVSTWEILELVRAALTVDERNAVRAAAGKGPVEPDEKACEVWAGRPDLWDLSMAPGELVEDDPAA